MIGLSNDKGNPIGDVAVNLSPYAIQKFYDLKKEGLSNASESNKMLNISPGNAANSAIPLVIEQMRNISLPTEEKDDR